MVVIAWPRASPEGLAGGWVGLVLGHFGTIPAIPRWALLIVVTIMLAATAVRVGYVLATPGYAPGHDDRAFDTLAVGVSRSGAYPDVNGHATAYRPPGYTYVLAGVYAVSGVGHDRLIAARLFQALVGTAVVALVGALAFRLFGWRAAVAALLLSSFYPPLILVGAALVGELQAVFLELAALLAVLAWSRTHRWRWVWITGVLGGALTLTRSNGFVVVVALAAGLALEAGWRRPLAPAFEAGNPPPLALALEAGERRPLAGIHGPERSGGRQLLPAGAALAIALAVVAPWTIRNAVVMHSFIPVSDELGGTLAGTYNPVSAADPTQPAYWHLLAQIPQYQQDAEALAAGPEAPFQNHLLHLALDYGGHHPAYIAKVAFYNTLRLVDLHGLENDRFTATLVGVTSKWWSDATVIGFWVVLPLAVAGVSIGSVRRRVPGLVWLAAGLLFLSIVFVNSETPRLRLPLDPFRIVLAAGSIATLLRDRRGRRSQGRRALGTGLVTAGGPVPGQGLMDVGTAVRDRR
jgi:4-amino-4-deoxy-L-arabinose transferase-like glycosyltransferase